MKIKRTCVIILVFITLFTLCSCTSPQDEVQDNNRNNGELSGTLRVTTYFGGYISILADEFMDLHPNVKIEIVASPADEYETLADYANRIAVEIMSGESYDLVDLGGLDLERYAKNGILYDLYSLMDSDLSFNKDDYYVNVFEAMEYENDLYALPFAFYYDLVNLSKPLAQSIELDYENLDSINYIRMLEIYENAKKVHANSENFFLMPGAVKEIFFETEVVDYYDVEKGTVNINSDEFIEFLNLTNTIPTPYSPDNPGAWQMTRVSYGDDDFLKSDFMFTKYQSNAIDLYNIMIDYDNMSPTPIPLHTSAGNAPFRTHQAAYGILTNSESKELAWEFLKYCISEKPIPEFESEEEQYIYFMMYEGWMPINIQNFYEYFRFNFEREIDIMRTNEMDIEWKSENSNELIDETLDTIHGFNGSVNLYTSNFELHELVRTDLETFYYFDLATAKEVADIIHNKVFTYIME